MQQENRRCEDPEFLNFFQEKQTQSFLFFFYNIKGFLLKHQRIHHKSIIAAQFKKRLNDSFRCLRRGHDDWTSTLYHLGLAEEAAAAAAL